MQRKLAKDLLVIHLFTEFINQHNTNHDMEVQYKMRKY